MQFSAVQYNTVQDHSIQDSKVQCSGVQCSAVQCSTVQCSAVFHYQPPAPYTWAVGRKQWAEDAKLPSSCTALYCTAHYCTALYCTALYNTALLCRALYCTVPHNGPWRSRRKKTSIISLAASDTTCRGSQSARQSTLDTPVN